MIKHFIVVCYDIPDDRRRTKLHKQLLGFGAPVQYSVFECLVSEAEWLRLQRTVRRIIKPRLDHVRYYHLCASCQQRVMSTQAGRQVVHDADSWVV
jgi:CRISPR-associated protein Cas2